jgi:SAM-dependent methyltransferase
MCHPGCLDFGAAHLGRKEVKGKRVLEVGSCDINGSLRPIIESLGPAEYVGVDLTEGRGVDIICDARDLVERFGRESFDIVISTEMLEHVRDWRAVISNMKNVCRPGGIMLITTCTKGFQYHEFPGDFWRYEPEDMEKIFSDCKIAFLEKDARCHGVFIKARKPREFIENDLSRHELYSIVAGRRTKEISGKDFSSLRFRMIYFKAELKRALGMRV